MQKAAVISAMNIFARGRDSNPIKKYMKSRYTSKVPIYLHFELESGNYYFNSNKKNHWLKSKILETQIKKYKCVNERLTRESSSIISAMEENYKPPKELILA